jgi:uncharacterized protein HemY
MVCVTLALGDAPGAINHARLALSLEGETPVALSMLARALAAAGNAQEARQIAARALAMQPQAEELKALVGELNKAAVAGGGWRARLRAMWKYVFAHLG